MRSVERYRAILACFFRQGEKRIWFASPMKFVLDQRFDRVFNYQRVDGLHHAELASEPSSGPLRIAMRDFNYSQLVDGRERIVSAQAHSLSIPFE